MNFQSIRSKLRAKAQAFEFDFFHHGADAADGGWFVSYYDLLGGVGIYDIIYGAAVREGREAVVAQMQARPGEQVLEVGIGSGLSLPLYPAGVRVTGIDLSEPMLKAARRRVAAGLACQAQILRMDAHHLQFSDNTFDKAAAMLILSVVSDPVAVLKEIKRVCKPGGDIFLLNRFASDHGVVRRMEKALRPLAPVLGFRTAESLDRLLSEAELQVHRHQKVNLFKAWTLLHVKNVKD